MYGAGKRFKTYPDSWQLLDRGLLFVFTGAVILAAKYRNHFLHTVYWDFNFLSTSRSRWCWCC